MFDDFNTGHTEEFPMKRLVFACFVFAVIAAPTWAQGIFNDEYGPVIYPNALPVSKILNDLSKEKGFSVTFEGVPPLERTIHGEFPRMRLRQFIDDILLAKIESNGCFAESRITIFGPGTTLPKSCFSPAVDSPSTTAINGRRSGTIGAREASEVDNFWDLPTPDGLTPQQKMEWYRKRRNRPGYDPCAYGDYPCSGNYPVESIPLVYVPDRLYTRTGLRYDRDYITDGYYGYFPYMRGCTTGPSGQVKFKYVGPPEERVLWEVEFDGAIIGSIDQADSFFNKSYFCVGKIEVTARKRGMPGEVRRTYSVRLADLTEITVGDFLFPKKER
jgi:hypothetical protein